ncbi:outer membrane receptor protein involved in Fe transport [Polymorphobacter multimanifer]|uniref:Outer membrane receptor protein involved in Fe transport n=1 Tax=Polymorphobacter multimanifer TaxID=1070431 RepID=A0A841L190_9SPHN|nr:TonB-dependent receptor [Polymorphobacter multimanifer]MBB6226589.1 outer membrane receptor protein involved in Fe transport [Polymorphobacter multimanifer]
MALVLGAQPAAAQIITASAVAAAADQPASVEPAPEDSAEAIVVTGSRIARTGYDAPTPVNIVTEVELRAEPQANIGDYVNTLPAVQQSQTSSSNSGSLSNGQAGIATVNLRALGPARTLILIDGQRSVASSTVGLVDVQTVPQGLIKGVEVVTGGASSVYGSDAVSGVVNFILNRDYTGFKAEYEYSETTYGDVPNHLIRLTAGIPFASGRGKILLAGDYFKQTGVDTYDRDWQESGFFQIDNPAFVQGNGQPERFVGSGIGTYQFTPGGIVNTGPLTGSYFGTIGANGQATVNQFNYGPRRGQWMIGGDYLISRDGHLNTNSLAPAEERGNVFGRISYEVSSAFKPFFQFSWAGYSGQSFYQQTPSVGVTIQRDNAFLPTAFVNSMIAANVTSVSIGTSNVGLPVPGSDNKRYVYRYVAGADGDFEIGKQSWNWSGYYQVGLAKTNELLTNTFLNSRMTLAQDAVRAPDGNAAGIAAGTIVCRSTLTNPTNGCVPLNRIGVGGATPQGIAYVLNDGAQPQRFQSIRQDVAALNFTTNDLFDNWAGPVSFAFGGEYRRERVDGSVDPQFNSGWLYGNYLVTRGKFDVKEAYAEAVFPVYDGLDLNGAIRVTDYSTSGTVTTWKLGGTWQPIDDLKLRVTRSRDIRAPNLAELFTPGTARTNTVNVAQPGGGQRSDQFLEQTTGNLALKPEVALTWGAGVVATPTFLPGFAASVDYFDIKLSGAIGTISAQTITTLCIEQNRADICDFITFNGAVGASSPITSIRLVPFNFAALRTRGIDFEASYRTEVGTGNLTLRGVASHYITALTDNGIDVPVDLAGQNAGGGVPSWNYRLSANYDLEKWGFNVVGRGFSGGVYDNNFFECTSGCPLSTPASRTINDNGIAGQWYLDASITHRFTVKRSKAEVFLYVRNLLNSDPVLVGNGPTGNNTPAYPQTNRALYDVLGRVFRVGVRFEY